MIQLWEVEDNRNILSDYAVPRERLARAEQVAGCPCRLMFDMPDGILVASVDGECDWRACIEKGVAVKCTEIHIRRM